jgi:hypothetical protein
MIVTLHPSRSGYGGGASPDALSSNTNCPGSTTVFRLTFTFSTSLTLGDGVVMGLSSSLASRVLDRLRDLLRGVNGDDSADIFE